MEEKVIERIAAKLFYKNIRKSNTGLKWECIPPGSREIYREDVRLVLEAYHDSKIET